MFEVQKIKLIIVDFFYKIKGIQFITKRMLSIVFLIKLSQLKTIKFVILKKLITLHFLIYYCGNVKIRQALIYNEKNSYFSVRF